MPKKRAPVHFTKPANPVHPSLSPSSYEPKSKIVPHSFHSASNTSGNSVNDEIQRLRLCQAPSTLFKRPQVPPSTQHMVNHSLTSLISDPTSHGSAAHHRLTPGIRPDASTAGRRTARVSRGQAGPPPPKSWLKNGANASSYWCRINGQDTRRPVRMSHECLDILPDLYLPESYSLMSQALKALARNWSWHLEWDQYHLAQLPTRYKEALLYFIVHYSPQGICRNGLEILFLGHTVPRDAPDNEDLTHLDFAASIGRSLSLEDLEDFLTRVPSMATDGVLDAQSAVPESWDAPFASPLSYISVSRFPSLTHLSLSHPTNASWKSLLSLVSHLATLTHLSLAYWPFPTLHSNSTNDTELPVGYGYYNPTLFYAFSDIYWTEAATILRHLSKKTYCLRWLDLTGCSSWIWALRCESGADWSGAWRRLETIKTGQGWVPDGLKEEPLKWCSEITDRFRYGLPHPLLDSTLDMKGTENQKDALLNWLRNEKHIAKLERRVNEIKSSVARRNAGRQVGAGPSVDELIFGRGEFESWWEDPLASKTCSADPKQDAGGSRVVFERGWEGWWIEDVIAATDELD